MRVAAVLLGFASLVSLPSCAQVEPSLDLSILSESGEDWELLKDARDDEGGSLRVRADRWLMFFTHWRPLTKQNADITPEYARNLLLTFWGDMPFTLTGEEGEMEVAGHAARFVEGTLGDVVRTRFIIWNCPETGRQFISDTNINIKMGTPPEFLELQEQMTRTVSCHGEGSPAPAPELPDRVVMEEYGLSFNRPAEWRTQIYPDSNWFPDGPTGVNGTLWTLPTDSQKQIDLIWDSDSRTLDRTLLDEYLGHLAYGVTVADGTEQNPGPLEVEGFADAGGYLEAEGAFDLEFSDAGQGWVDPQVFRAFLWQRGRRTFLLVVSMAAIQDMWGIPYDLSPSAGAMDRFLADQVCPALQPPAPFCSDA